MDVFAEGLRRTVEWYRQQTKQAAAHRNQQRGKLVSQFAIFCDPIDKFVSSLLSL